jgi:Bifunctional DNA primase/polymerase, N-terminal
MATNSPKSIQNFTVEPDRDIALGLARRGVPVFPCRADKAPHTGRGFKDATTDGRVIQRWWRRWPDALIGVPTGIRFDVVDVDCAKHPEALAWLREARLPETRIHHTRSGGLHFLFRPTPGLTNSASKLARGIDVRAKGGYVIWWPAQGLKVSLPNTLAEMPDWVVEQLKPPLPHSFERDAQQSYTNWATDFANEGVSLENRISGALALVISAPDGEQNNRLYWASRRFVEMCDEGLLDEADALELLLDAARGGNHPEHRAQKTIQSAFKAGRQS